MPEVIVFFIPWCQQSDRLMASLRRAGIAYRKFDAEKEPLAETLGVDTTPALYLEHAGSYHRVDDQTIGGIQQAIAGLPSQERRLPRVRYEESATTAAALLGAVLTGQ